MRLMTPAAMLAASLLAAAPAVAFDLDLDLDGTFTSQSVSQITGELSSFDAMFGVQGVSLATVGGVSLDFCSGCGFDLTTFSATDELSFGLGTLDGFAEFGAGSEGFGSLDLDVDFED